MFSKSLLTPSRFGILLSVLSFLPIVKISAAEDGKALYATYCAACHALDGKGAGNGAFPPLANSPWVAGHPDRAIQIILHGLVGEIVVPTETNPAQPYNLVMPPQGGTLTDPQIVAILNYVRNSWGNKNEPVTLKQVQSNRKLTKDQKSPWRSVLLLRKYPLPKPPPPVKNLISKVYKGKWKTLPDFSKLSPDSAEEEHDGFISLDKVGLKNHYGVVWEGDLEVPEDGTYTFDLNADDGAAVYIGGKLVTEITDIGPVSRRKSGKIDLKKGTQTIKVEYYQVKGHVGLILSWRGPGLKGPQMLSPIPVTQGKKDTSWPSIPIDPPKGGTAFYRGFIENATPRAIGVGYDGGINIAFSSDHMSMPLVWQGRFFDGGRHWTNRGRGNEPPPSKNVTKLSSKHAWGILNSPSAKWATPNKPSVATRFRGYKLGEYDRPTFYYDVGNLSISDTPTPDFDNKGITRTLTITAPKSGAPLKLHLLLANGMDIKASGSKSTYMLGSSIQLEIDTSAGRTPLLRNKELILPLNLKPGENQITLRYLWK